MKFFDFEKHIHETLSRQEIQVDTGKLIHALFDKKNKKRRVFPFWWVFVGVTIGIGAFIGYSELSTDNQKNQNDHADVAALALGASEKKTSISHSIDNTDLQINEQSNINVDIKESSNTNPNQQNHKNSANKNLLFQNLNKDVSVKSSLTTELNEQEINIQTPQITSEKRELDFVQLLSGNNHLTPFALLFQLPKNKTVKCPSFSLKKKISFFIQPEIGLSFPIKTLQERLPDNSEVTAFRKENEKTLEGIHGALYFGMFLGKSQFYVKSGITYSRISEKLDLVYHHTRVDTSFGIVSITKSQTGDTITVIYGDILTESTTRGQKIKHHYFHVMDIPFCVGYQYHFGSKFSLGVEAGLILNIGLRTDGQVLSTLHDFKPVEKSNYQQTLGLGYRGGLAVEYALNRNVALGLDSRLTVYNKPFTSQHSNFKQNYMVPGLHLYGKYYLSN